MTFLVGIKRICPDRQRFLRLASNRLDAGGGATGAGRGGGGGTGQAGEGEAEWETLPNPEPGGADSGVTGHDPTAGREGPA